MIDIYIRPVQSEDQEWMVCLADRFNKFELAPFRSRQIMNQAQKRLARMSSLEPPPHSECWVAVDSNENQLGYLLIGTVPSKDYAFIYSICVSQEAEGKEVAKFLMQYAENWALQHDMPKIELTVFAQNQRARSLYERMGYQNRNFTMYKVVSSTLPFHPDPTFRLCHQEQEEIKGRDTSYKETDAE